MQMIKDKRDRPAGRFFVNTVMNLGVMSKTRFFGLLPFFSKR